jgi:hypothetical protein
LLIPSLLNNKERSLDANVPACTNSVHTLQPALYNNRKTFRNFCTSERIKVLVNGEDDKHGLHQTDGSLESSLDHLALISSKIEEISPGELKDVEVREACGTLSSLAHSMHKRDSSQTYLEKRGRVAWNIFRRLLVEDNLFDPLEDTLLPIHGYPVIIDHTLCHNVSFLFQFLKLSVLVLCSF